jgi:hypothetical protein
MGKLQPEWFQEGTLGGKEMRFRPRWSGESGEYLRFRMGHNMGALPSAGVYFPVGSFKVRTTKRRICGWSESEKVGVGMGAAARGDLDTTRSA